MILFVFTVSFDIYDFDGDSFIGVSDLTSMLAAALREHDVVISRPAIDEIVANTFVNAACVRPMFINYEEYLKLVASQPQLLAHLSLNISGCVLLNLSFTFVGMLTNSNTAIYFVPSF